MKTINENALRKAILDTILENANMDDGSRGGVSESALPEIVSEAVRKALSEEGIHIKEKNRGKFNATKERTGKSTEELTHSKNPLTRKRAIFAQNAKNWNKKK